MRLMILTAMLACTFAPGFAAADDDAASDPKTNPARTTIVESLGTIEARDLLRFSIVDLQGPGVTTTRLFRVDEEGHARFPYLKSQKLAGLSTAAAEKQIARAYREQNVIPNANLAIVRVEAGSRVKNKGGPIAEGDLVAITVDELTGQGASTTFKLNVGEDGEIAMPLAGNLQIAGLSEAKAEQLIAKTYLDQNVIRNPIVSARVLQTGAETKIKPGPLVKGDLLEISIWQLAGPEGVTTFRARIDQDGLIGLPVAGALRVESLSESKASKAIAQLYRDQHLIQNAMATALRVQSAERADVKLGPIAKGEIVRVTVQELTGPGVESTQALKVDENGNVQMPLVSGIKVEGLTETAAAKAIDKAYRDANLVHNAFARVLKINGDAPLPDEPPQPAAAPPSKAARR